MNMIAPYITEKEYMCPCCHGLPPDLDTKRWLYDIFFSKFKEIREEWGKPIQISSGYRCLKKNAAEGGKDVSVHLFGLALDLNLPTVGDVFELDDIIETLHPDLRRGMYTVAYTFIHIDAAWLITPRISLAWSQGARWTG
jgi:hypothetical protein